MRDEVDNFTRGKIKPMQVEIDAKKPPKVILDSLISNITKGCLKLKV